ncbi:HepT-like ribonuclease domain-containing protein [Pseudomonas tolaasii]|uniref:HepT-like ribonuclease domain-containing protein n=1 Tax=Pseudomonas tolaasii TaxID=29442 RepID=UPI0030CBA318
METTSERWERFLDPEVVKPSLFLATMFITAFEILKNSAIDRLRNFYTNSWDENGPIISPDYQNRVLYRNKSTLYASFDWLQESGAIDSEDLERYEKLKRTRNLLAHQLFEVVTGQIESNHEAHFEELLELLRKIEVWWVVNLEISTNPDFDGQEVDEASIVPGSILSLQMLIEVASGNTELLEHWRKAKK